MTLPSSPAAQHTEPAAHGAKSPVTLALMIGALGVVFGDIGTSPLYAFKTGILAIEQDGVFDPAHVMGILSLIFWLLTVSITLKYVTFILRADNDGEGGVMALMTLMKLQKNSQGWWRRSLLLIGLTGAACLLGEGVLTPAISILSAVEGIQVIAPQFDSWIIPITLVIIGGVFYSQRHGTEKISRLYGPLTFIWFLTLGILGLRQVLNNPDVLEALNPIHAGLLFYHYPGLSSVIVGAVFLAVTGGEALYADLGHFGRRTIQNAWLYIAMPCLVLNYFGQGALVLADQRALENPFYMMAPEFFLIPLLGLATMATVIASQSIITGAFSLAKQAIEVGYLPPMHMTNTSELNHQHIYIGRLNHIMLALTIFLVLAFRTSENLAHAYGIAVALAMLGTCTLYFVHAWSQWSLPKPLILIPAVAFIGLDVALVAANMSKIGSGGWFPLVMAGITLSIMLAWNRGLNTVVDNHMKATELIEDYAARTLRAPLTELPKAAVFFSRSGIMAPIPLEKVTDTLHAKFAQTVIVSLRVSSHPRVALNEAVVAERIDDKVLKISIKRGYLQSLIVPALIAPALRDHGINPDEIVYVIGHDRIVAPREIRTLRCLQAHIFAFLASTAERAVDRFGLPRRRTIEIGYAVHV
ncbi:MAG: KUP/HAK/KT family potassium transporter [Pseudomonadota bacterium]